MTKSPAPARLGSSPEQYRKLGISPDRIEPFEDGMRTDGRKGDFEWWYFDAHLDDGSKLVITFYTKDCNQTDTALAPYADIVLDRPDGTTIIAKTAVFTGNGFQCIDRPVRCQDRPEPLRRRSAHLHHPHRNR